MGLDMAKGAGNGRAEQAAVQSEGLRQAERLKVGQSGQRIHSPNWQTADEAGVLESAVVNLRHHRQRTELADNNLASGVWR